jgi:mono/diheme cytochrome c family protein
MFGRMALVIVLTATVEAWAPAPATAGDAPIDLKDPAHVAAGQTTFNHSCAGYCHGRDGRQGKAPTLRGRDDLSPDQIHNIIANGKRDVGKIMPAWKGQLDDEKIWQITAFIVSLRDQP